MDWLGKMIGLPDEFLHSKANSAGGGVIQTTASESTFVCLLAARTEAIRRFQKVMIVDIHNWRIACKIFPQVFPEVEDSDINCRLVAYCSDQAHSSVEKAGLIGLVKIRFAKFRFPWYRFNILPFRYIETDDNLSLRGDKLREAIAYDRENGLIPFYVSVGCSY